MVTDVRTVDALIVGAGPAGTCAAMAARQWGLRVLLLDRAAFPRDKACGDGVAGHVFDDLAQLGLIGLFDDRRPTTDLELGTRTVSATRPIRRPIWGIPRRTFDARLLSAAQDAGAEFVQHTVRDVRVEADRVVVDDRFAAAVLIAADGVESAVRRRLGIPPNGPVHTAVAIRGYTPSLTDRARLVAYGRDWPAYAWEFPLGDGISNVGYGQVIRHGAPITRALLLERLDELMPGATEYATDWRAARIPLSTRRPRQPDGRVLLVGDAASLVNPMSGEGIWYAVRSGILAGRNAELGSEAGLAYRQDLWPAFARNLRHANLVARIGQIGGMPELGTRMTVVDEAFFHDQVGVSVGGGTYRWPTAVRALASALNPARRRAAPHNGGPRALPHRGERWTTYPQPPEAPVRRARFGPMTR